MGRQVTAAFIDIENIIEELSPVLAYWGNITPDGAMGPSWSQFDLLKIPSQFLPYSTVVDYNDETAIFRYRFYGSKLSDVLRSDFTGKTFEDLPDRFRDAVIQSHTGIVDSKKPGLVQFSIDGIETPVRFQKAFRLPLSNDGNNISNIVSIFLYPWSGDNLKYQAEKYVWSDK